MASSGVPKVGRSGWMLSLGVSFVALLALALIPWFLERQQADLERDLDVFAEARPLIPEIALSHANQMMRVEQYVASGDSTFLGLYREDLQKETARLNELEQVIGEMPDPFRYLRELSQLEMSIGDWQVLHAPLMAGGDIGIGPEDFGDRLEDDRVRYEAVRSETRAFEDRLIREAAAAAIRWDRQALIQLWVTLGTIVLAIVGAAALGLVGYRLQELVRNETSRRQETVAARRGLRAVLGGTGDVLVGLDHEGRCTFLNDAGAELLGYSPRELRGQLVHALIHHTRTDGTSHPAEECPVRTSLATGETVRVLDDVIWRKDGSSFPVQLSVSPMKDGLEVKGVVLTLTDMTEMREAEEALRAAVRARDEVLAVVSHDLRNPVGTISAAAELLADVPLPPESRREHLEIIDRAADRINRLIQDLLDVAQIEAGQLSVWQERIEASGVLDEAIASARARAEDEGVTLSGTVDPDLPSVHADRDRILQVLSNLIVNALKFTPAGGEVTVTASGLEGGVLVSVRDNGPGIEPEMRDHLFDRFWKGHRSGGGGAGLGLAIVDGILAAHGAKVRVETEVGAGTCFSFVLPPYVETKPA
jgi:PAS domain S-box-containing protein